MAFCLLVFFIGKVYLADVYYERSQKYILENNYIKALDYSNKSVNLNPFEPNYYRGRAKVKLFYAVNRNDQSHLNKMDILSDLEKAKDLNDKNLVTLRNEISLYYFLAIKNANYKVTKENIDEGMLEVTNAFYNSLFMKYPNDLGVLMSIANYQRKLGLEEEYKKTYERIRVLRPDILEWHEVLK